MTGELEGIWVVENPKAVSEVDDIMYFAEPVELFHIAKGTMEDPKDLGLSFYETRKDALRDAKARIEKRDAELQN